MDFSDLPAHIQDAYRRADGIHAEGAYSFDREYFAGLGRYPEESPLFGTTPVNDKRRQAIIALVEGGATEGERSAAQSALERHDAAAMSHSARMGRLDSEAAEYGGAA